jgi:uncharacterized protein (DUF58 family)
MNIVPTLRFYLALLLVLAIVLLLQPLLPEPRMVLTQQVFLLLDLIVALLVAIDILLTPNKKVLSAQRDINKRFSIGRENPVTVTIENLSAKPLYCRVTDDYPQAMNCAVCDFDLALSPGETKTFSYLLIPRSKGIYNFGSVYIRFRSRLGFFDRQIQISVPEQVKVYNDLQALSELSLQLGTSSALGEIQRKHKGQGTNFTGLTEYVEGKDVNKIDWKATARAQRPIIREYDREEEQRLLILVDGGRMMFSELSGLSKFDHALNAALSLSLAALTLNDQVGLGIFADSPSSYLPPRRGRAYLQKFLDVSANATARQAEPDYLSMLSYFAGRQKGRTLFVVITDLVDAWGSRSLLSALASLRQKHLTFCVVLADERIEKMVEPDFSLADIKQTAAAGYVKTLQRAVATDLFSQRQLALDVLRRRGCLVLNAAPEQLSSQLIASYLEIKRKALL